MTAVGTNNNKNRQKQDNVQTETISNDVDSNEHQWTFTLVAPNVVSAAGGPNHAVSVKLSSSSSSSSSDNAIVTTQSNGGSELPEPELPLASDDTAAVLANDRHRPPPEREPLLTSPTTLAAQDDNATTTAAAAAANNDSGGWTFSGPEWSLSSNQSLLKLTYRPAWEALPEYTNTPQWRDMCRKLLPCCGTCSSCSRSIHHFSQHYTMHDVVHVKELPNLTIRGLGACRGVQLFLKHIPCPLDDHDDSVPPLLRAALRRQLQLEEHCGVNDWDDCEMMTAEPPDSLPLPPWQQEHDGHDSKEKTSSSAAACTRPPAPYGPIVTFAMPIRCSHAHAGSSSSHPLLWKVQVPPNPLVAVETYTMLDGGRLVTNNNDSDSNTHHHLPTHVYINGYQSWSFSGSVVQGDKQPKSAMHDVFSRAFNFGGHAAPPATEAATSTDETSSSHANEDEERRRRRPCQYQADFFACITSDGSANVQQQDGVNRKFPYRLLDETGGPALLVGWLSQHHQLGVVTADANLTQVDMHASAGPAILRKTGNTDWAYAELIASHTYDEEPMVHYLHAVAAHNEARPLQNGPLLTGWCSWYHYYENISAASLRENFAKLQALRNTVPTNVSVVDDGYMTAWGDWDSLKPKKFPETGMKGVADDIRSFGMRPGVWLAPFACDKHSKVAKQHPDWIIYNDQGRPANSSNCGKFFYGLDATNPHVREYVHSCVKRAVHEWGFNVLKIDFLYAACLEGNGKYDLSMSRAEAMHLALRTIRSAAGPDVFLIGCGCPIGTGIGYADGMRVSADTGPTWYPAFPLPWWDNGTLPALRAMIRNSMSRAILGHRWWHNDPDCLLLGETTKLTDTEVASAASIVALTCGMLLLSDDLTQVSESRMKILSRIFPMTGATAVVLDLHNTNDGLPSLLRLWCTDRYYDKVTSLQETAGHPSASILPTLLGRLASFDPEGPRHIPNERKRNCIHVARGMGTWTLLSISNWLDEDAMVDIPSVALAAPPSTGWTEDDQCCSDSAKDDDDDEDDECPTAAPHGYHVFTFWSSTYTWMPEAPDSTVLHPSLSKRLSAHETEIFHLRAVTPEVPQYVGSDIHFSCGQEVQLFEATSNRVKVCLKNRYSREGHMFLFIPRHDLSGLSVKVNGKPCTFRTVGNTPGSSVNSGRACIGRIISIPVVVRADDSKMDGEVMVSF